jgi:peptidoglycan/LPS O-acetylase OafA/YrhL
MLLAQSLADGDDSPVEAVRLSMDGRRVSTGDDRLPALDGIRAIAIALVLIGHCMIGLGLLRNYGTLVGEAGVSIFFVLSGFLVTRVMLLDEIRTGRLRLGRFYRRRALRIFPAFYAFLGTIYALSAFSVLVPASNRTWMASAFYFRNVVGTDWNTGHLWSLSLEEQFYFLWPVTFLLLKTKRRRLFFIGAAVIAGLAWRSYWLTTFPSPPPVYAIQAVHCWPQMRLDTFLIGAAFAIGDFNWVQGLLPRFILPFLGIWCENAPFHRWTLPFDSVVTAFVIGTLILWLVQNPQYRPAYNLSRPAVAYIGALSYSIYLWQQVFLGPHMHWWSLGAISACAIGSYYVIERPALRWKEKLEHPGPVQPLQDARLAILSPTCVSRLR